MFQEKHYEDFCDKILPAIHKTINPTYYPYLYLKKEELEQEKFRDEFIRKQTEAKQKIDYLKKKRRQIEVRKQEESIRIASVIEKIEKKTKKIQLRNEQYKNLKIQMENMVTSLEEKVEVLEQRKDNYKQHAEMYKPCKDLIISVAKVWPTVITEFELQKRFQSLITHKVRFSDEYQEYYKLHEAERRKFLYVNAKDGNLKIIILSNKLDELDQEHKDVMDELQKEEEIFRRMMDNCSEIESALSEIHLGCLRLYNMTKSQKKTCNPFEHLSVVQEFGFLLISVVENLQQI